MQYTAIYYEHHGKNEKLLLSLYLLHIIKQRYVLLGLVGWLFFFHPLLVAVMLRQFYPTVATTRSRGASTTTVIITSTVTTATFLFRMAFPKKIYIFFDTKNFASTKYISV